MATMKSLHELLTELANDLYLLHDTTYDLRHDVGAVINWRKFFDIDNPSNSVAIILMREVKIEADRFLASIRQQLFSLPQNIRADKRFKKSINNTLIAVNVFCCDVDDILTPTPTGPINDKEEVDQRNTASAVKARKEEDSEALIDSINAMCKELKETELLVKRISSHESVRSARQT